jgi:hypothetical protein
MYAGGIALNGLDRRGIKRAFPLPGTRMISKNERLLSIYIRRIERKIYHHAPELI